ncbi:MAG: hypothetical protein QM714_10950 [Nocardioides sp.]|uniref:hypothetical protein n=1 Tax=Nocardioides sp. TaxID=35761 RepID=UPI0039E64DF8
MSFQIQFGLLFPEVYRAVRGKDPMMELASNFIDGLDHDRRHFLDSSGNIWEFDGEEKLAEFTESFEDLARGLAALGDDPRLLVEVPNDIDLFSMNLCLEDREMIGAMLASGELLGRQSIRDDGLGRLGWGSSVRWWCAVRARTWRTWHR